MTLRFVFILFFVFLSLTGHARSSGSRHSFRTRSYHSRSYSPRSSGVVRVRAYRKKNGTYVKSHYRTRPDLTKLNNWSTKGNINPMTDKKGYVIP